MTRHEIDPAHWRAALETNRRVAVIGRSLLLGVVAGAVSGGFGAVSLAGRDWLDGALFFGGIIGALIGLVFGGILAPFVLKRAQATSGCATRQDRMVFAASAILPAAAGWLLIASGTEWPVHLIGIAVSFLLAAAGITVLLGWCMTPLQPESHVPNPSLT